MTPLQFETAYASGWDELETLLPNLAKRRRDVAAARDAQRAAALYRAACEHLALARSRAYPIHLVQRLDTLTQDAHNAIYRRHDWGLRRLGRLFLVDFPEAVRAHRWHMLAATLVFVLPMLVVGVLSWRDPGFILSLHDASTVAQYDSMYGDGARRIGARRGADTDAYMFGFYVMNNISVALRCFASGIFLGIGSLFALGYNGLSIGGIAGYLTWRGHGTNFWSFVVTHSAFELTAIVISGAAGLALGGSLLAPGRRTRLQALQHAARQAVVLVYGVVAMLLVAALLEAFWSSSRWVPPEAKYALGAVCWAGVLFYLFRQGRPR